MRVASFNLMCASKNLDDRVRAVEGVLQDAVETFPDFKPGIAAVKSGQMYQEVVREKSRGHDCGPPHLSCFSDFLRALAHEMNITSWLREQIQQFVQVYPEHQRLAMVVVSIFSAVLVFQSFNDMVETFFLEGKSLEFAVLVDMLHLLVWFWILQLSLAKISGVIGSKPRNKESTQLNMKTVAVLLAHLTGFASINAWGSLHQLEFFNTPFMSLFVVPISGTGQFLLQIIIDVIRDRVSRGDDGRLDEYVKLWDEETEDFE